MHLEKPVWKLRNPHVVELVELSQGFKLARRKFGIKFRITRMEKSSNHWLTSSVATLMRGACC